jgi:ribosomal protein S18 acetylase RimI-like enzyme
MDYREATASDAHGIARLHAESWRRNYRGAFSDAFLDGPVIDDRTAVWTDRLSRPRSDQYTVVADADGRVAGFAHVIFDADLTWGSVLDNLHVDHAYNRQGVGAALMAQTSGVLVRRSAPTGFYLWVLEQNVAAQGFYRAQGGSCVERALAGPFPGGGHAFSLRFAWRDLSEPIGGR